MKDQSNQFILPPSPFILSGVPFAPKTPRELLAPIGPLRNRIL